MPHAVHYITFLFHIKVKLTFKNQSLSHTSYISSAEEPHAASGYYIGRRSSAVISYVSVSELNQTTSNLLPLPHCLV